MNREIKFRIWNAPYKMIYDIENVYNCLMQQLVFEGEYSRHTNGFDHKKEGMVWMQFTGLTSTDECNMIPKDCYFGDIIRFYTTDGDARVCEVMWYELEHCIGFKRLSDGFVYTQRHFNDSGYFQPSKIQFEIIGNIYENADILTIEA